jgi:hypothetical protein
MRHQTAGGDTPGPVGAPRYDRAVVRRRSRRRKTPKRADRSGDGTPEPDWVLVGDRRMFVVGYTSGGAPFGCFEDELEDLG